MTWLRARANWALLAARGSSSDVRAAVFDEVILAIEAGAAS